jgi:hypothetical protein
VWDRGFIVNQPHGRGSLAPVSTMELGGPCVPFVSQDYKFCACRWILWDAHQFDAANQID